MRKLKKLLKINGFIKFNFNIYELMMYNHLVLLLLTKLLYNIYIYFIIFGFGKGILRTLLGFLTKGAFLIYPIFKGPIILSISIYP